jgi:hypothetical protein
MGDNPIDGQENLIGSDIKINTFRPVGELAKPPSSVPLGFWEITGPSPSARSGLLTLVGVSSKMVGFPHCRRILDLLKGTEPQVAASR